MISHWRSVLVLVIVIVMVMAMTLSAAAFAVQTIKEAVVQAEAVRMAGTSQWPRM